MYLEFKKEGGNYTIYSTIIDDMPTEPTAIGFVAKHWMDTEWCFLPIMTRWMKYKPETLSQILEFINKLNSEVK